MKSFFAVAILLCGSLPGFTQLSEFTIYSNGLIYDDTTISRLKSTIDSLHINYRQCALTRTYHSIMQSQGTHVWLDTGDIRGALNDLQQKISLQDFIQKYPDAKVDSNLLLTFTQDIDDRMERSFYTIQTSLNYSQSTIELRDNRPGACIENEFSISGRAGDWVYDYDKKQSYSPEGLNALLISQPFKSFVLPSQYARMVLYADCMIDTLTDIFLETAGPPLMSGPPEYGPQYDAFAAYLKRKEINTTFYSYTSMVDSADKAYIKKQLSSRTRFKKLLSAAVEEALKLEYLTTNWFEMLTALYYSKEAALTLKRNRTVFASCSRDQQPRIHLLHIALLAAETANWPVFLRAHLNIMNDYTASLFSSYYGQLNRNTYIKELEELGIDVEELLPAICLRIADPATNHYFGAIGRIGRAFAEAANKPALEQKILSAITDSTLDDYNRLLMHYLFLNYVFYLDTKEGRLAASKKLEQADRRLPAYIACRLQINPEIIEKGAADDLY